MDQTLVVEKILRSLTSKFNYVVCSIEESNDVTTLSIDELQSSLLVQEQHMKSQNQEFDAEQALKVSNGGRGSVGFGRGRGKGRVNKASVECFKYHKLGHYQNECPLWEENANYAEFEDGELLLMAQSCLNTNAKDEAWFLDSGCSNHMIGTKDWLFDFDSEFRESVKLGDDSEMPVMGRGNLKLLIGGIIQVITNVYYLPGLRNNSLSIGQLQQKNLTIVFQKDTCKAYHEERGLIMSTQMSTNRMFVIYALVIIPECLKVEKCEDAKIWHYRYGHLSWKGLKILMKKNMVRDFPEVQEIETKCKDCLFGKQHRDTIPKKAHWRASQKLELIHSDLCGPTKPSSNSGNRYFMTFTYDFSRKTWIYILKDKSRAFEIFKVFKILVEKESECLIKCLRSDRGGEYTSTEFNEFCNTNGIKRQLTTTYTPQQNGVSERKNRTLMSMVRSMLAARQVPKVFWPEAAVWATHVLNRSPTLSVKDMTPEEAWSGVKPSVQHFRVFGCISYVHVPDSQRKKLDDKSFKCILVGLSEESKGYKLYDPKGKKVVISRDVVFEES